MYLYVFRSVFVIAKKMQYRKFDLLIYLFLLQASITVYTLCELSKYGETVDNCNLYFTTKCLHEQYRVSSGHYRWL